MGNSHSSKNSLSIKKYSNISIKLLLVNCGLFFAYPDAKAEVTPVLGDSSVVDYQLSDENDYTFKVNENGTINYYKVDLLEDNLESYHVMWDEVPTENNDTISVTMPHNGTGLEPTYLEYWYDRGDYSLINNKSYTSTVNKPSNPTSLTSPYVLQAIQGVQKQTWTGDFDYIEKVYKGNRANYTTNLNKAGETYIASYGSVLGNIWIKDGYNYVPREMIDIVADFIENSSYDTFTVSNKTNNHGYMTIWGGAGGNLIGSSIESITGEFIGNYIEGTVTVENSNNSSAVINAYGGALGNQGTIGEIAGEFINNYIDVSASGDGATAYSYGGAIYNAGEISAIEANFLVNRADHGGAIYNANGGNIDILLGNFISNQASEGMGGAIYGGGFDAINGDFISNTAEGDSASGGAIHVNGQINELAGEFIANSATGNREALGGALYIGDDSGITSISSNFIANRAEAVNGQAKGGAIYVENTDQTTTLIADSSDLILTDNKANGRYNDIYLKDAENFGLNAASNYSITLNGTMEGETSSDTIYADINKGSRNIGGTYVFNNEVSGLGLHSYNGAYIKLGTFEQSDGTTTDGYLNLESFSNDAQGGLIDALNGVYRTQVLGNNVKLLSDLDYAIDILVENNQVTNSDMIEIASTDQASVGSINLVDILFAGANPGEALYFEGKKQIVNNSGNSAVTLKLEQNYETTTESLITDKLSIDSKDINWDTGVYLYDERSIISKKLAAVEGESGIVDSIEWVDNGSQTPTEENIRNYDALVFLNQTDMFGAQEKTFTDTTTGIYNLTENLGQTYGSLSVIGRGKDTSTLNMASHQGFDIGQGATVKLSNIAVDSNKAVTVAEVSEGGTLQLDGVELKSKLFITNNNNMELSGTNVLNGEIDGQGTMTVLDGQTTVNNDIVQNDLVISDGNLITNANNLNIVNDVQNGGTLTLTGGDLSYGIKSTNSSVGTVELTDTIDLVEGGAISGNRLDLTRHRLNVEATGENVLNLSSFTNQSGATLNTQNGSIQNQTLGVAMLRDLDYMFDVDALNGTADTLTLSDGSSGNINLANINFKDNQMTFDGKIRLIENANENITLTLNNDMSQTQTITGSDIPLSSPNVTNEQEIRNAYKIDRTRRLSVVGYNDESLQDAIQWVSEDSQAYDVETVDTLAFINMYDTQEDKSFTFVNDETYEVSENVGTTSGTLTINGKDDGSTIDFNGKEGFDLNNSSTLNIKNTKLTDSSDNATINSVGALNMEDVELDVKLVNNTTATTSGSTVITKDVSGNGKITNSGDLTLKGINNNNAINGSGTTYIEDEVIQTAEISQDLTIKDNATLTTSADNIKSENAVENNGRLALVGGTLNKGIASDGVTEVRDDLTIAEGGTISGNSLELGTNDLTVATTTTALNLSSFTNQSGATLNTQNGSIQNQTLGSALIDNLMYALDIDLSGNGTADTLTVDDNSTGIVKITSLNFQNPTVPNKEFEIGIINGNGVTLELDSSITDSEYTIGTTSESKDDKILANTLYDPEGNYFSYTRQGDVLGKIDLTDDQKGIKLSENSIDWKEWKKGDSLGDTLMLVNTDETNEVKTLNFASEGVDYKVSDDAGETKGSVAINGVSSDGLKSTIDLNGHSGFKVGENADLTIRNTKIIGDDAIVSEGEVTLDNADVETLTNDGSLNIANNSTFSEIKGSGETNITSDLDLGSGKISGNTVNALNGTVKVGSDNLADDVVLNAKDSSTIEIANNQVNVKEANFDSGSTLSLKVNSLSDYGSLRASTINVEQGANLNATLAQGIVEQGQEATIQLLVADNENFNEFSDHFENNMYEFEKDGKNGAYNIKQIKTAEDVTKEYGGTKTNQEAAKAWIDNDTFPDAASQEIANDLSDLAQNDAKGLQDALTAIAPNDSPMVQGVVGYQDDILFRTVASHLRNEKDDNLSVTNLEDGISLWVRTYLGSSKLNNHAGIHGFNFDSKGIIAALEKKVNTATKVGLGYHYDQADVDAYRRDVDVEMNKVFAYAEYKPSEWFVNATASYGNSNYKEDKYALGNTYKAKYDVDTYSLQTLVGYEQEYITPEAGLRYYHIKRRRYEDSAMQKVSGKELNVLTAVAGVRAGKDYALSSGYTLRPEAYLGAVYDIASDRDNAVVSLSNGANYMVHGKRLNKFGVELGGGLTATLMENLSLNVRYLGAFRRDYRNHTGMIGLEYSF